MGKIFAIGGGEIALGENDRLNSLLVALSEKEKPRLLFIPTASSDAKGYIDVVQKCFSALGCTVSSLCLYDHGTTRQNAARLIDWCDIIYVGGGDTLSMMEKWQSFGLDEMLVGAYEKGKVMSGINAGAICWFAFGHSDSLPNSMLDASRPFGLGLIPAAHCPHYDAFRHSGFDEMLKGETLPGVALGNGTAFVQNGERYYAVYESPGYSAYLIKNTPGGQIKKLLAEGEDIAL